MVDELKRSRTHIACEVCRKRKIRCDAVKPTCTNCLKAQSVCVYPEDGRRKRHRPTLSDPGSPESMPCLARRIGRVEQLLEQLIALQRPDLRPASVPEDDSSASEGEAAAAAAAAAAADSVSSRESASGDGGSGSGGSEPDLLQLCDRRSPAVIKLGDGEPIVTYTHGFTTSLLNPTLMRQLCEKIGRRDLGEAAETKLRQLWRQKMCHMLHERISLSFEPSVLSPALLEKCLQLRRANTSNVDALVCDHADLELIGRMCCPNNDFARINFSSPYSLLYLIAIMQFADEDSPHMSEFAADFLREQNTAAFKMCLHMFVPTSQSTFLLLRLRLYAIFVMYPRVFYPHLRSLVAVTLSMAYDLGLHRVDGSRYLRPEEKQRRAFVWVMLKDLDVKLSCIVACVPQTHSHDWPRDEINNFELANDHRADIAALLLSAKLDMIYIDMYRDLFSQRAQRYSVRELMDKLCAIVQRLNLWYEELPPRIKEFARRVEEEEKCYTKRTNADANADAAAATPTAGAGATNTVNANAGATNANAVNAGADATNAVNAADSPGLPGLQDKPVDTPSSSPFVKEWTISITVETVEKRIAVSMLLCYYHTQQLVHSIPMFTPSCLNVYKTVPPALRDSQSILSSASVRILRFSFHPEGIQSFIYLPVTATNAFSALFLKQIRNPHDPANAEHLTLIHQYIHRFREIAEFEKRNDKQGLLGTHVDLVLNMWSTFANILTDLQNTRRIASASASANASASADVNGNANAHANAVAAVRSPPPVQPITADAPTLLADGNFMAPPQSFAPVNMDLWDTFHDFNDIDDVEQGNCAIS